MIRVYGIAGALCLMGLLFTLGAAVAWVWAIALILALSAGAERADLEATRRAEAFLTDEVDRMLAKNREAANGPFVQES